MNKLQQRLADKRANEEAGFTLIELLVVIVILGILAAVVVFSVRGINDRGAKSACQASRSALITGEEAFYATNNANAAAATDLEPDFINSSGMVLAGTSAKNDAAGSLWTINRTLVAGVPTWSACP